MTFLSRLATGALLATVAFGSVAPALAHHIPRQAWVETETNDLLNTVNAQGIPVVIDAPVCKKRKGLFGMAILSKDMQRQYLMICLKNHKGDLVELADTVRHEAFHVAQHCRARRYKDDPRKPLLPAMVDRYRAIAQRQLHMPMERYDRTQWAVEAEARVAAQVLEEEQIAYVVERECGPLRK